jgi:hypothetical protein
MTDLYEKCISMNPLSYALRSSFSMYISNKVHPTLNSKLQMPALISCTEN